ncbi:FAD-binding oxidoreductase [Pseudomonas nabeulensis]|uniref:FAD-binding oxidoreductase n=1 Tax=Pseudomonas nabeulensis TaxID=2293833 RepID=A0A4Z0B429_9PSED|nr:FAD-binding oxidoreductase [Pseudomonas nabeulensis]TFY93471.1 FAD-binding oxidoreductase [Pseudomonas nabeulensis]
MSIPAVSDLTHNTGPIYWRTDPEFEKHRVQSAWNGYLPERYPIAIVVAHSEIDIINTLSYACANGLQVSCKTGGHSYSVCFLKKDHLLLDMSCFKTLEIDNEASLAYADAGVTSRQLHDALSIVGLAFPVGHGGDVTLAGFLVGGGQGINCAEWGGMSTFNIEAVEVITATGEKILSTPDHSPEYLWAARGGGAALFFVVVRFHLRCYPVKKYIAASTFFFKASDLPTVVEAIKDGATKISRALQIMVSLISTSEAASAPCSSDDESHLAVLSTLAFASDEMGARKMYSSFTTHVKLPIPLQHTYPKKIEVEDIFTQTTNLRTCARWRSDNILTYHPSKAANILLKHFSIVPSKQTQALIIWRPAHDYPDAAYSAKGSFFISTYTQWSNKHDDIANRDWLYELYEELSPFSSSHYLNEFDREGRAHLIHRCYSSKHWKKLLKLKNLHDPLNIFG